MKPTTNKPQMLPFQHIYVTTTDLCCWVGIVYLDTFNLSAKAWVDSLAWSRFDSNAWICLYGVVGECHNFYSQHNSSTTCYILLLLLLLLLLLCTKRSYKSNLSLYRSNNPGSSINFTRYDNNLTSSECVSCGRVTPGITRATAFRALLLLPTD